MTLKWQRIADSDGGTIMYTAVAARAGRRAPYYSYRITPVGSLHSIDRVIGYRVSLWLGDQQIAAIGSVPWRFGRGEYRLADAKRASQDHYAASAQDDGVSTHG